MLDTVAFDSTVFDFYWRLIGLRHSRPALRRGMFRTLAAEDSLSVFAFLRGRKRRELHDPTTCGDSVQVLATEGEPLVLS